MNTNNQTTEIEIAEDTEIVTVTDEGGKKTKKRVPAVSRKLLPPTLASGRDGRIPCAGGCGTMVIKEIGECRKCRRARMTKGRRIIVASIKAQQKKLNHANQE